MTCIVGVVHGGDVTLAADSIAISGYQMHVRPTPKVFRRGAMVIGCAGSFRMADVIRYHFAPTPPPERGDLHRYMATTFVETLREACKARGVTEVENNVESIDGVLLVGVRGALYEIDQDFHVGQPAGGFSAVGCGAPVALGALYALAAQPVRRRCRVALSAASTYNAGVRGPWHFITLRHL